MGNYPNMVVGARAAIKHAPARQVSTHGPMPIPVDTAERTALLPVIIPKRFAISIIVLFLLQRSGGNSLLTGGAVC